MNMKVKRLGPTVCKMKNANTQALNKLLATGTKNSRGDEPCSIYLMHVAVLVCRRFG